MSSGIITGKVLHHRLGPTPHRFVYPLYLYCFDLDDLPALDQKHWFFGYNRLRPISVYDKDHLFGGHTSLREKLLSYLEGKSYADEISNIKLITAARFFNYIFNPVSFYYCYNDKGQHLAVIAEVNNTFGERHPYILDEENLTSNGSAHTHVLTKQFHVSPFFEMNYKYRFRLSDIGDKIDICIDMYNEQKKLIHTRLHGGLVPLSGKTVTSTLLRYPLTALLTVPRICYEAAKLYYVKKLPFITKPTPSSPLTLNVKRPSFTQRIAIKFVEKFISELKSGSLEITLPNGEVRIFGDHTPGTSAKISVKDHAMFPLIVKRSDVGFAEAYVSGMWDTECLNSVLRLFTENLDLYDGRNVRFSKLGRSIDRLQHVLRKNSLSGSKKNIQAHYDLSNELFELFLDESMMYSSAVYDSPNQSLEEAQKNKICRLIEKARIKPDHHLLEIGSGWGGFAIEAARQTGCRVTTITVSKAQYDYAKERIENAGLGDRVEVKLVDYRKVTGQYDRIVSIEMLEAVGHSGLGEFFKTCDRLLRPDGVMVLQVITIPEERYEQYRKGCDFIQKYIFPGGHCPSLQAINSAAVENSRFYVDHLENIGNHYATTLAEWKRRFNSKWDEATQLGFDEEFKRLWNYYLTYCEEGFATRMINTLHLVFSRQNNNSLSSLQE